MGSHGRMMDMGSRMKGSSGRMMGSSGRMSTRGIGHFDDDDDGEYNARATAYKKFMENPTKYTEEHRSEHRSGIGDYGDRYGEYGGRKDTGPTNVVIEHSAGCTPQSVCDSLRESIKVNFPEVKFREITSGRPGSFEVFLNGKLLYSKIMQGGYPYEDEVLDSIDMAKHGEHVPQLQRGSYTCTIL